MLRSRRFAFAAAAVLLGLSACGDAASTTTAGKAPAVIHIGSSANSGKMAAGSAPAADRMMAMQDVTYVFDGTFPDLGSTAPAWVLPVGGVVDQARIAKLAALLGVEGDVRALPADQGGGFMVGAEDYSTANLTVSSDGMLSWWFNPAPMTGNAAVECVTAGSSGSAGTGVAVAPDAPVTDPAVTDPAVTDPAVTDPAVPDVLPPNCATPTPPANVPTKDVALAQAKALFTNMGYDVSQFQFDAYADEWGANVQGYRLLDGHRSPLTVSVGYGAEGALTWASGALAEPQSAADYPLVSGDVALQRLNDRTGQWAPFGGPGIMAAGAMAKGGGVALDAATTAVAPEPIAAPAGPGPAVTDVTADTTVVSPMPIDPPVPVDSIQLEPITIHLNAMRLDMTMVWAEDGTIWLLPAYTFTATDGGEYTIVAVDGTYLDTAAPTTPDTIPVDSAPVDTVVAPETVPAQTLPVDTVAAPPTS